jgi:hypothetical protein
VDIKYIIFWKYHQINIFFSPISDEEVEENIECPELNDGELMDLLVGVGVDDDDY